MNDEKRFCRMCNWNDCDYGCTCPPNEEVYQCAMYMYYHPEEVDEFNKAAKEFAKQKAESEDKWINIAEDLMPIIDEVESEV